MLLKLRCRTSRLTLPAPPCLTLPPALPLPPVLPSPQPLLAVPLPQVATCEAELQRWSELLTEDELADCQSSGEGAVRRERVLARAHMR